MEEEVIQETGAEAEATTEEQIDEIGELKNEINRLREEMEVIRGVKQEEKGSFEGEIEGGLKQESEKQAAGDELDALVEKMQGGQYREALESLLQMANKGKTGEPEIIPGGAIERESFLNSKGIEDLHGKVDLAMELRRHGIPRADVVRLLRASGVKSEATRFEEPTGRVAKPADENKIIQGYWKKALA